MSKRRVTTRQIKHDEFISTVSRLILYLEENVVRVIWVVVAVAILVGAGVGIGLHLRGKARAASFALGSAIEQYREAGRTPADDTGYETALHAFRTVAESHPGSAAVPIANFYAALCLIDLDRFEEAEVDLVEYLDTHSGRFHAPQARLALARLAADRDDPGRALELLREAAEIDSDSLPQPEALMELARFLEQTGDRDEAVLVYDRIGREFPLSEYVPQAQQRAQILAPTPNPGQ